MVDDQQTPKVFCLEQEAAYLRRAGWMEISFSRMTDRWKQLETIGRMRLGDQLMTDAVLFRN